MPPKTAIDYFALAAFLALAGPPVLWLFTRRSLVRVHFPWPPFARWLPPWPTATWGWACVACELAALALLLHGLRLAVAAPAPVMAALAWVEVMSICFAVTLAILVALFVPKRYAS